MLLLSNSFSIFMRKFQYQGMPYQSFQYHTLNRLFLLRTLHAEVEIPIVDHGDRLTGCWAIRQVLCNAINTPRLLGIWTGNTTKIALRSPSRSFLIHRIFSPYFVLIALVSAICSSSNCIRRLVPPSLLSVGAIALSTLIDFIG